MEGGRKEGSQFVNSTVDAVFTFRHTIIIQFMSQTRLPMSASACATAHHFFGTFLAFVFFVAPLLTPTPASPVPALAGDTEVWRLVGRLPVPGRPEMLS